VARSKRSRSSDAMLRWRTPSKRSRAEVEQEMKEDKRELWDPKTVIACHVQPMLICLTNSFLLRLHDGLHPAILRGAEEALVSTPERFYVKDEFDGPVLLALHAAANAAFEPEPMLDPAAETARRRVRIQYRHMIRTFILVEMLLGVSGHSVCLGGDDRSTGRVSLMKGLKEALVSFASCADLATLQRIAALGCRASLLHISDQEDEDEQDTEDSIRAAADEEDDF